MSSADVTAGAGAALPNEPGAATPTNAEAPTGAAPANAPSTAPADVPSTAPANVPSTSTVPPSEAPSGTPLGASPDAATPSGPGPLIPSSNVAAASWALFTGVGLLMLGNGLQGSLLGIRAELEGFSAAVSGAIMAAYFGGFLVGSRAASKALGSVGHIRVFAALASLASSASLAHALAVHPVTWLLMRFATGLCMAGLYVVIESWINDLATNATRGRLLAAYMVVSMGGMAGGQFLLNAAPPEAPDLFLIASVLVSLALVPVALSAAGAPPMATPEPMSLRELFRLVPVGPTVASFVGVGQGALLGMGAFYATRVGLSPGAIALFMFAPMIGGVVLQVPIGMISDRVSRRAVMVVVAAAAAALAGALMVAPVQGPLTLGLLFLLGGCTFPLYSLGIAYTNDRLRPEQATGASASLVMANGMGAVAGPVVAAGLIVAFGNAMFWLAILVAHAVIAVQLGIRLVIRPNIPLEDQGRFEPIPARASATAMALLTRRRRC